MVDVLGELLPDLAVDLVEVLAGKGLGLLELLRLQRVPGEHRLESFNAIQNLLLTVDWRLGRGSISAQEGVLLLSLAPFSPPRRRCS